jgi:DNA replication protein DnaC
MKDGEKYAERMAFLSVAPALGGISLVALGELHNNPEHEANARCSFPCSQGCGTYIEGTYFFSHLTACDACRDKAEKADKLNKARIYWEAICPAQFRDHTKTHPKFPKAQYELTKAYCGQSSLFFYGPSGSAKTSLAMWLLKRCLVRYNQHVAVLWPEQLKATKQVGTKIVEWVQQWGRYDLLLIDDGLLAAANDSRCTEAFKDLLDYRMRYRRHVIVTSQIGGDDMTEQAGKFGKDTKADKELIAALVRRMRETCEVVSFAQAKPQQGEETF